MTGHTRVQDWPERLQRWVDASRTRPFAWGEWDCVIAAADAVTTVTDADPLAGLVWFGAKGALRQLEVEGGLHNAVTARLGEPIAPALAQRGDLVLLPRDPAVPETSEPVLCVCVGEYAVAPGAGGLKFRPMAHALLAWKVGR